MGRVKKEVRKGKRYNHNLKNILENLLLLKGKYIVNSLLFIWKMLSFLFFLGTGGKLKLHSDEGMFKFQIFIYNSCKRLEYTSGKIS